MQWQCNFCITKTRHILVQLGLGLVLSILLGLGFGFFVMLLWNSLLPDIWGWREITYWQGTGLVILTRLLFGSQGYHKEANQPQAGCRSTFSQPAAASAPDKGDRYFEKWWAEEGEAAWGKYTQRLLEREAFQQDK
ncbi:hypothetical protein [Acetonema longum]|uniref:Uncharacterized protein n=1 Tax=Acetonema longum DSM 6540 TaxID=1009370 RepID=F7NIC2_9FIRM|nr:hypothetical protein [Acetonema longum]EGO64206.1 hypothetical protein ALO_09114 [Acetonema longum DSM 6540]